MRGQAVVVYGGLQHIHTVLLLLASLALSYIFSFIRYIDIEKMTYREILLFFRLQFDL